jgi:hypothetical protein
MLYLIYLIVYWDRYNLNRVLNIDIAPNYFGGLALVSSTSLFLKKRGVCFSMRSPVTGAWAGNEGVIGRSSTQRRERLLSCLSICTHEYTACLIGASLGLIHMLLVSPDRLAHKVWFWVPPLTCSVKLNQNFQ